VAEIEDVFGRSSRAVRVRGATLQDTAGILLCLRTAFAPYQELYTPTAFEDTVLTPELLDQRLKAMTVFVAETNTRQIIGTIACSVISKVEGHLRGMGVLPAWQGRGVAKALLQRTEDELSHLGCEQVTLDTTEPLVSAMRFYERNGFRRTGKISDFFGMSLIEYAKQLREPN